METLVSDFMLGVVVGILGLTLALTAYVGIAQSIERNKEEKEWIRAQYGVSMETTDKIAPHWSPYKKEEVQRTTDDGE